MARGFLKFIGLMLALTSFQKGYLELKETEKLDLPIRLEK